MSTAASPEVVLARVDAVSETVSGLARQAGVAGDMRFTSRVRRLVAASTVPQVRILIARSRFGVAQKRPPVCDCRLRTEHSDGYSPFNVPSWQRVCDRRLRCERLAGAAAQDLAVLAGASLQLQTPHVALMRRPCPGRSVGFAVQPDVRAPPATRGRIARRALWVGWGATLWARTDPPLPRARESAAFRLRGEALPREGRALGIGLARSDGFAGCRRRRAHRFSRRGI